MKKARLQFALIALLLLLLFTFPIVFSLASSNSTTDNTILPAGKFPLLKNLKNSTAVLYFGYVGCLDTCPKGIQNLSANQFADTKIYFVNLIPGLQNADVQKYVQTWDEGEGSVIGIQATATDLANIENYFGNFQAGRIGVYNPELHANQVFLLEKTTDNNWQISQRYSNTNITGR